MVISGEVVRIILNLKIRIINIVAGKEVPSQLTGKDQSLMASPVFEEDYGLLRFLTSPSRPIIRRTIEYGAQAVATCLLHSWQEEQMTPKLLFFPMALESIPLRWFNKLRKGSVDTWEDSSPYFLRILQGSLLD